MWELCIHDLLCSEIICFQSDDGGEYKCVASNDAGTSEGVAYRIIRSPPTFKIAPPREVKVKLGRDY